MRSFALSGAIVLLLAPLISTQERDALKAAAEALSVDHIKTLQVIASGATFTVGQNFTPSDPWPRVALKRYMGRINYETGSMQHELLREMGTTMPRGGGVPFTGELHQIQAISGQYAWNIPISAVQEGGAMPVGAMHTSRSWRYAADARTRAGKSAHVHAYALGDAAWLRESSAG
jgi:hypothetical protein